MEEAAVIFGWPNYYSRSWCDPGISSRWASQQLNARKWFATIEIEWMSRDPDWLDKAIRIVEKQI
jgi:hypothetical protein